MEPIPWPLEKSLLLRRSWRASSKARPSLPVVSNLVVPRLPSVKAVSHSYHSGVLLRPGTGPPGMPEAGWQQLELLVPAIGLQRPGSAPRELTKPDLGCDFPRTCRANEHPCLLALHETSDLLAEPLVRNRPTRLVHECREEASAHSLVAVNLVQSILLEDARRRSQRTL